jgi:hypothetical protein
MFALRQCRYFATRCQVWTQNVNRAYVYQRQTVSVLFVIYLQCFSLRKSGASEVA